MLFARRFGSHGSVRTAVRFERFFLLTGSGGSVLAVRALRAVRFSVPVRVVQAVRAGLPFLFGSVRVMPRFVRFGSAGSVFSCGSVRFRM